MSEALVKLVTYMREPMAVMCDAKCNKAWGINQRPCIQLSNDDDDTAMLSDDELGEAPADPGTYEDGQGKPQFPDQRMNKWCVRECERSVWCDMNQVKELKDFSRRRYNLAWREAEARKEAADAAT